LNFLPQGQGSLRPRRLLTRRVRQPLAQRRDGRHRLLRGGVRLPEAQQRLALPPPREAAALEDAPKDLADVGRVLLGEAHERQGDDVRLLQVLSDGRLVRLVGEQLGPAKRLGHLP